MVQEAQGSRGSPPSLPGRLRETEGAKEASRTRKIKGELHWYAEGEGRGRGGRGGRRELLGLEEREKEIQREKLSLTRCRALPIRKHVH
jgi:hypothetical protein